MRVDAGRIFVGEVPIDVDPAGRISVIALGKASVAMARAAIDVIGSLPANRHHEVRAVIAHPAGTNPGEGWPPDTRCFAGGHPLPDAASVAAAGAAAELCARRTPADLVVALVSGGGSALFELPRAGVNLDDLRELTRALLLRGASIHELNAVRRAISRVKGGGLARMAAPARVVTLIVSDVAGDSPADVASGPTVASSTTAADARAIVDRFGLTARFSRLVGDEPVAGDPVPAGAEWIRRNPAVVIASNRTAVDAVHSAAAAMGFDARIDPGPLTGEARDAGSRVGRVARAASARPACVVWGGETTVTVRGGGTGGRNQELALSAAVELDGCPRTAVMSFATDGIDGPTGAAGAVVTGETLGRARRLGLSAARALDDNDSNRFFRTTGDLVVTGPTGTNVNDIVVALLYG